ncbi:CHAD domain-containing protein, partial [Streptomyces toxytricini]|uniref:CHAD domain-containing protein n=1 Tax=Streptomyces toxytricini TaxID=67369 RepID=UPI00343C6752
MALPNPDPTAYSGGALAGDVLGAYLRAQATAFLRALRLHGETAGSAPAGGAAAAGACEAARGLRLASRRIAGSLATFRAVTDTAWADGLRGELAWLSSVLADEHASAALPTRLRNALHRLSGSPERPGSGPGGLAAGPARAAALLERQLAPARARAHAAALQAMGSSRFHAVADAVAVLASEVPLEPVAARGRVADVLVPLAE